MQTRSSRSLDLSLWLTRLRPFDNDFHRHRLRSFCEHLFSRRKNIPGENSDQGSFAPTYSLSRSRSNMQTRRLITQGMESFIITVCMAEEYSRTTIGLRVKDGIVLAVEKLVHSKLLVPGTSNRRIQTIDKHIGLVGQIWSRCIRVLKVPLCQATAGYLADGRHLANRARSEASNFREFYHSPPQIKVG